MEIKVDVTMKDQVMKGLQAMVNLLDLILNASGITESFMQYSYVI